MRNELIDLLVNLSDRNCATFMQRMFIAKSTSDSSYSFARDALTGGAAAAAAPAPIAAVGLGFGSLLLRSWESVDKTFFLNSAYQSLESAIQMERDSRMTDLRNQCRMPSEGGTVAYGNCTIHEAMRLVGRYGDACSLRAGVGKLQSLVHAQEEAEATRQLSDEKLRLEKAKTQLEKELAELRSDASRQVALSEIATKMQQVTVALDSIAERQAAQTEQITKLENNPPGATSEPVP
jgi:hypothetical protein